MSIPDNIDWGNPAASDCVVRISYFPRH